jgi:hypothetical protein
MRQKARTSQTNLWAREDFMEWGKPTALPGRPSRSSSPVRSPWLYVSLPLLLWLLLL